MEKNINQREQFIKLNFFKKVWYSITKFEKYPEMAALGVKKAILYFTELMLIFSIVFTGILVYYVSNIKQYEEKDLTFSEKVVEMLGQENEEYKEKIMESMELIKEYQDSTIIVSLLISSFISFYIATLIDVFTLSIFGLLTCWVARIKMNYKAVFNMSIFSLTLSIILRLVYIAITTLTGFQIKYFDVMYIAISYISLAAAIFLIKSDVIKQHLELMKIIEESKEKIEETIVIPKRKKEDEKDDESEDGKPKEKDKGEETEGSNA